MGEKPIGRGSNPGSNKVRQFGTLSIRGGKKMSSGLLFTVTGALQVHLN